MRSGAERGMRSGAEQVMGSGAELVTCTFPEWFLPLKLPLPGPVHDWWAGQGSARCWDYETRPAGRGEHTVEAASSHSTLLIGGGVHSRWEVACISDPSFPCPRKPMIYLICVLFFL